METYAYSDNMAPLMSCELFNHEIITQLQMNILKAHNI